MKHIEGFYKEIDFPKIGISPFERFIDDNIKAIAKDRELILTRYIKEGLSLKGFFFENNEDLISFIMDNCSKEITYNGTLKEIVIYKVNDIPFLKEVMVTSTDFSTNKVTATNEVDYKFL